MSLRSSLERGLCILLTAAALSIVSAQPSNELLRVIVLAQHKYQHMREVLLMRICDHLRPDAVTGCRAGHRGVAAGDGAA
jgi:hypothetical protein